MGGNDLKKAVKLYKHGKFTQVLQLLEAQIFRYRQNYQFYYTLGMSCLHTGDYSGAASFLQRALSLRPGEEKALLGMAVVHLKQQKTAEALQDWFEVIDQNPRNVYAQRGLAAVKKYGDPDRLYDFTESRQIRKLIPSDSSPSLPLVLAGALGVTAVLLFLFFPLYKSFLPEFSRGGKRIEIAQLDLTVGDYLQDMPGSGEVRYELSEREIRRLYDSVIENFHAYNDNLAQRDINRLILSNASEEIKRKASLLEGYVRTPTFDSLNNNFDYTDVRKDPLLYDNCFVIWRGKVSNLQIGTDSMRFDLLAGYETEKILEGIVPVRIDFAGKIDPAFPIEVLGQIEIVDDSISLNAVSIHQFVQEED